MKLLIVDQGTTSRLASVVESAGRPFAATAVQRTAFYQTESDEDPSVASKDSASVTLLNFCAPMAGPVSESSFANGV